MQKQHSDTKCPVCHRVVRTDTILRHFKAKHPLHKPEQFNLKEYRINSTSMSKFNPNKKPCMICGKGITPKNKSKHMKDQHGIGTKRKYGLTL